MNHEPKKRIASEPVVALLSQPDDHSLPQRRPFTTTLGAILVFFRGISGALLLVLVVLLWQDIEPQLREDLEDIDPEPLYYLFVVLSAVTTLALLLLVVLIWRGNNFARVLAMSWLSMSIVVAAIGYFTLGEKITLETSLLLIALDVLVLLALSSRDSRAWSQMTRAQRQAVLRAQKSARS